MQSEHEEELEEKGGGKKEGRERKGGEKTLHRESNPIRVVGHSL